MYKKEQEKKIKSYFVLMVAVLGVAAAQLDWYADKKEFEHYCEMVRIWNHDKEQGIPNEKRHGWPNYKQLECSSER